MMRTVLQLNLQSKLFISNLAYLQELNQEKFRRCPLFFNGTAAELSVLGDPDSALDLAMYTIFINECLLDEMFGPELWTSLDLDCDWVVELFQLNSNGVFSMLEFSDRYVRYVQHEIDPMISALDSRQYQDRQTFFQCLQDRGIATVKHTD